MKNLKKSVLISAVVFGLSLSFTSNAETNGTWKQLENKSWNFIQNGKVLKNKWIEVKGSWYYLDLNGNLFVNKWIKDQKGEWYFLGYDGAMYKSRWLKYKNIWYYFNQNGEMVTNDFINYNGQKYYFNQNGEMVVNSIVNGYKIDEKGIATKVDLNNLTGFITENKKVYFYDKGKKIVNRWYFISDKWYYFDLDGAMYYNKWLKYKEKWYFFDTNGEMLVESFIDYNNKIYYFNKNGEMVTNSIVSGYKIDENGVATKIAVENNGFVTEDSKTYFYKNGKKKVNDWEFSNGEWYYFGSDGAMYVSRWLKYKNVWYYFNRNGEMVTNDFVNYNGKKYYFDGNGNMVVNREVQGYRINENGEATKIADENNSEEKENSNKDISQNVNNELKHKVVNGKKIYLDNSGNVLSNRFYKVSNNIYYFNYNGEMVTNNWIEKFGKRYFAKNDGSLILGFGRDNNGIMRYFSIVDGEMQVNIFAYDKKTKKGYNIDANGVGVESADPRQDFINMVKPYIMRVVKDKGLFPSIAIAQAALETGYGSSTLGYPPVYNLFGIKAPDGAPESEYIAVWTTEYDSNQNPYDIIDKFKKFKNYEDAFQYYANLFTRNAWLTKFYKPVVDAKTPEEAAEALTGRYATDPNYGSKLLQIIEKYQLKELDKLIYTDGVKP